MKKNNKILILYLLIFIFISIGASFAYFTAVNKNWYSKETKVTTAVLPSVLFESGDPINIYADELNFLKDSDSLTDGTYVKVSLKNGDEVPFVNHYYNVDLVLDDNDFIYSTESKKPEVLLNVYDNNGEEVKSIDGLIYKNVGNLEGFDITSKTGNYNIVTKKEIKTETQTSHIWKIKITFVNLNDNQDKNGKCKIKGYLNISSFGDKND